MSALPPLTRDQFFGELFASKAARDGAASRWSRMPGSS